MKRHLWLGWVAALVVLILALLVSAAPGGAEVSVASRGCPPSPSLPSRAPSAHPQPTAGAPPAAGKVLVCVGSHAITGGGFSHWLVIAKKGQSPKEKKTPAAMVRGEVLGFLISAGWESGEAERLKLHVERAQVQRSFKRIRDQQFPKHGEFKAFLRSSGESVADLMFRVKLNLLSQRVLAHVEAGHHSAASKQRALARFVKGFKARWRARTYCAAGFVTADCGHVLGR